LVGEVRAALGWVVERGDAATGMHFVAALMRWFYDEAADEGRAWAGKVLRLPDAAPPTTARAHTLRRDRSTAATCGIQADVSR
jgi:hypothetical protein